MSDLRIPDLNRVTLAGRLTRDPELKYLPSGTAMCKLGLAVSRFYRTKDGERKEETLFVNAVCWAKTAEYVGEHMKKGRPVLIEGRLKSDEWEDKDTGQKRSVVEVMAERVQQLDWDGFNKGKGESTEKPASTPSSDEPVPEDDIPF